LITGITGQIGSYLGEILQDEDCIVYGITRSTPLHPIRGVIYVKCDISDVDTFKDIINHLCPDEIYHFAAQTAAATSVKEPEKTLWVNGNVVMAICEAILSTDKSIKLFVANSSELFKGRSARTVNETDLDFYPKNPYGIGKLAAYWTCQYYREYFGLHICSGIIFNAESPKRNSNYVTSKIVKEIVHIAKTGKGILSVGNIDSWRDWIHAYDVANAAKVILSQERADDYIISLNEVHKVRYLIDQTFLLVNMNIVWIGKRGSLTERAINRETGETVVEINKDFFRSYETSPNILKGNNSKLLSIGWRPQYTTVIDIMRDMIDSYDQ